MIRRPLSVFLVAPALLVACSKPPVQAPKELDDLSAFLFANFDNEDPAELIAGIPKLNSYFRDYDLRSAVQDRAVTLLPLEEADFGGITGPAGALASDQTPVGVFGMSDHPMDDHIALQAETNHVCIESASTKYYSRTFDTDLDAFLNGESEFLRTTNEVRKESIIADVWYDLYKDYRMVVDEESGDEMMIGRSWTDQQYFSDGGNSSWDQLYGLEIWVKDGKTTNRFYALWSAVTLSAFGDDFYVEQVKLGLDEGFVYADDFLVGGDKCKNDRDYQPDPRTE